MTKRPESLKEWINYLAEEEFPVLSKTMSRLGNLDDLVNYFSSEMASIILQDPNMTARVLKMANSAHYNVGMKKINTVSRAVMFLGYDVIRSICLSSGVFQQLLKKDPSKRLLRGISSSFQSAVQSQQFSEARKDDNSEELFIASMLFHMGEMAFWTFGGTAAKEINELMIDEGFTQIEAQEEVLGFRLSELTFGLAERWGMGNILLNALRRKDTPESASRNIILSHRLLNVASRGWGKSITKKVINELSCYANLSLEETRNVIINSAETTVEVLKGHGFTELINNISFPPGTNIDLSEYQPRKVEIVKKRDKKILKKPDQDAIVNILNELEAMENESSELDINFVLQLVLEGVHRGVGMDRALVSFIDHKAGKLAGKYAVQDKNSNLVTEFSFTITSTPLFQKVIKDKKCIWSKKAVHGPMAGELLAKFKVILGTNDFLAGPMLIQGRPLGMYYADRQFSGQKLTLGDFEAFQVVVKRANEILDSFGR
ncbi:MAG: HD-like signal output (HDOD) protein [Enterobacterales bacterium]